MVRGHEEASTNQARGKRGTSREMPTTSSLVAAMSVEDLRSFGQVNAAIRLEMPVGAVDNAVYFTQEQFAIGFCLLVASLVKKFLHFTRAPLVLVHSNVFRILMGYNVLKFLYQLDISLVEICFIYTLNLGIEGHLSMKSHSPRQQFVIGLSDSPQDRSERGPWCETSGSLRLPFDLNHSFSFPGLFQLGGTCTLLSHLCF